jgi:hypothetical protein
VVNAVAGEDLYIEQPVDLEECLVVRAHTQRLVMLV